MKGWRAMRAVLSHFWAEMTHQHYRHQPPTTLPDFDMTEFEQRLVDTERRLREQELRLQIMALEGEVPRGHEHDGN